MILRLIAVSCIAVLSFVAAPAWCATISGELKTWHKVTLTLDGPQTSESASPNPFTDYRLDVTFSHNGKDYVVPGYFAADGDAANTSAEAGNKWRVHFSPDAIGQWTFRVSFRKGPNVTVSDDPSAGESAGHMDGETGSFAVAASDKSGGDFRSKGRLQYDGTRYLRFAGSGQYFLKCGVDAPENFLAYADFDGGFKSDRQKDNLVKTWQPHVNDWKIGDPTWQDGKGRGIIGALNYLAAKGLNGFSTLTMNINGDDRNIFPYTSYNERLRFDVSRLDQWEIVFEHADRQGLHIHLKTQETENETLLDNGDVGPERRLYYRELIARFAHHLALTWNMGEENGRWNSNHKRAYQSTEQRLAMAQYFHDHDPYHHLIVNHNGQSFDDLLGPESAYTGASVQTNMTDFSRVHGAVLDYINKSAKAGKQWVVACDEPGDAQHSLIPDSEDPDHDNARKNALWGVFMAGAQGIEWYFGYAHDHSDLTCQDFRSRDKMWDQCRIALEFFEKNSIPFWRMHSADDLVSNDQAYCFCDPGGTYVVYLKEAATTTKVDLGKTGKTFAIGWYNPRRGGELLEGTKKTVSGAGSQDIGSPPSETGNDWVALIRKVKG